MFQVIWELRVKFKDKDKFEKFYDPKGEWVRFFQKANGYEGTEVLESGEGDNTFLVIDEWESEETFNACIENRKADFALLEEKANAASRNRKRIFISLNPEG
ncbi:MAG: antibiotic biosynthesis monooxygenase [Verrucomicrobia bacterium]|nr:antibiotic biosynthesis monooxygenase [Prolixibacteraceae bacterium]